ncbi:MAG TPA: YceH family protein [Acidimicrobiia bacterium]|nr:YceH family protein [Acidimicrobiia bacterium]
MLPLVDGILQSGMESHGTPPLDPIEGRVLGVLVEKQMTTPDNYPLTLAGVVAGCNQSTNREPVMSLDQAEVEQALVRLHDAGLATPVRRQGDRTTKYRHKAGEALEIDESAQAVLAVLLLRGPQTGGELRGRTDRYVAFASTQEVESVIDRLEESGLALRLPRIPGQSQRRVRQLLAASTETESTATDTGAPGLEERVRALEERFEELLDRLGVEDL